jgi:hypothetical protein
MWAHGAGKVEISGLGRGVVQAHQQPTSRSVVHHPYDRPATGACAPRGHLDDALRTRCAWTVEVV